LRQLLVNAAPAALIAALALTPLAADAGDSVNILILKEHGVGSASSAQEYVDKLVARVAKQNEWPAASGKYVTTRSAGKTYIKESSPHFGILSLAAFLDLRGANKLEVVGSAEVSGGGGRQYFIVSAREGSLAGCKGKTLGTDHGDDVRFIDKVVGQSDFSLSDFKVEDTRRPMATVKAVARGEVDCALIDDAQQAALASSRAATRSRRSGRRTSCRRWSWSRSRRRRRPSGVASRATSAACARATAPRSARKSGSRRWARPTSRSTPT